jgi:hypothetical protein
MVAHIRKTAALVVIGTLAGLAAGGPIATEANAATARGAEILGFRAGGSRLVEPGGTIVRACAPRRLVAQVAIRGVRRGALVQRRWRHDGELVKGIGGPWRHGGKRRVVRFQLVNPDSLPGGRYQLAVKVPGKRWVVARVQITC